MRYERGGNMPRRARANAVGKPLGSDRAPGHWIAVSNLSRACHSASRMIYDRARRPQPL